MRPRCVRPNGARARASRLLLTRANALAPRKTHRAPETDGLEPAAWSLADEVTQLAVVVAVFTVYLNVTLTQPLVAQMQAQTQAQLAQMQAQTQAQQAMVTTLDAFPTSERLNIDFDILLRNRPK